ncbi:MAG: cytochrome c oxidase assembly protein [Chloroflexi bacterium]|nr:cytochrome c oxidase assembly protein [Chloroflexota bacterium]
MSLASLTVGSSDDAWFTIWRVDPLLAPLLMLAAVGYALAYRAAHRPARPVVPTWQAHAYLAGLASLAAALMGPPDYFGGTVFAAHMVQHFIITLVAPPLIVLGRPIQVFMRGIGPRYSRVLLRATLGQRSVRRVLAAVAHPLVVVLLFNGSLLAWHLPAAYQAAVQHRLVHDLEHATFLGTALLFWWVLIEPMPRTHRLSPTATMLALFASWMSGDMLGAALTLAQEPLYPIYVETAKPWGLTPLADQRLGGLIMWVGGGGFFAVLMIAYLAYPHVRRRARIRAAPSPLQ